MFKRIFYNLILISSIFFILELKSESANISSKIVNFSKKIFNLEDPKNLLEAVKKIDLEKIKFFLNTFENLSEDQKRQVLKNFYSTQLELDSLKKINHKIVNIIIMYFFAAPSLLFTGLGLVGSLNMLPGPKTDVGFVTFMIIEPIFYILTRLTLPGLIRRFKTTFNTEKLEAEFKEIEKQLV